MPNEHKWLTEDDEGGLDAQRTAEFVTGVVRQNLVEDIKDFDQQDDEVLTRVDANVQVETLGRLQAMQDKADRGMIYQLGVIIEDGIYQYSESEPSTISEMLAAAMDEMDSGTSQWYDLTFIADQLLPFMVAHKIPNAAVLWAKGFKKKARAAVPLLRYLFANEDEKKLPDKVRQVIAWIVDKKISKQDLEEKVRAARGVTEIPMVYVKETILPRGRSRLVIECDKVQRDAIVRKLKGMIDVHLDGDAPQKNGVAI